MKERIAMLVRPLPTTLQRRLVASLTYAALAAGSYALWTMQPGSAHAQAGPEQTTTITARSIRFVSEQGRIITFVAHDFETRLGDGNNDFEVTQRADRDRTGLYSPVTSAAPAALIADRVSRLANGDLELSGLIVKLAGGPNRPMEFERVRIDFESGVLTDNARNGERTPFARAMLTTDRAIVQDDGTIRIDSAVLTLVAEQ
jgi:hypothetical protein